MKAKIQEKKQIAENTLFVRFDLLGKTIDFKPGQFFFVTLINPPYRDSQGETRHFSIVNPPTKSGVIEMTTRIRDTAFKRSLKDMATGSEVEIGAVAGDFVLPEKIDQPLIFIAGGIGITPFMSMISYIIDKNLINKVTLFYSSRNQASAAFLPELKNLAETNSGFKLISTMTDDPDWTGEKGRIDAQFIKKHIEKPDEYLYFVAGPPKMVHTLFSEVKNAGVNPKQIKTENFSGY